jgi:hypothetical protein
MNEKIKKIIIEQGTDCSGKWMSIENVESIAATVVNECITAVENTPKHCAYTTFQEGIVDCTIGMSVKSIKQHFNLNNDSK